MIRLPSVLIASAAALLAAAMPLSAQGQPGGFVMPQSSPSATPTPAPQGPVDERAGVAIPPRTIRTPAPTATATPTPAPTASAPVSSPTPAANVPLRPSRQLSPNTTPALSPVPSPTPLPSSTTAGEDPVAARPEPVTEPTASPLSLPDALSRPATEAEAEVDAEASALPDWWLWTAGGVVALAALFAALALRRRRAPKAVQLAAPAMGTAATTLVPDLPRIDLALDVTGATRSVMMFTLQYRLTFANRTERAVSNFDITVQLVCAGRGADNATPPGASQQLTRIDRIGPHQSRSVTGTAQLPLSAFAILQQGRVPLFIPLVHVTIEGEGQVAVTRSFVIGTPSAAGRVHPIQLDTPPGSVPGLTAQAVAIPPAAAA